MMFHTVRGAHPDFVATDVLGDILTVEPAGRLYKSMVETKKAAAVESWNEAQRDPGTITFFAQIPDGDEIAPARDAMFATIENIGKQPITEAEVARIRTRATKYYDDVMSNPQKFGVAISGAVALGDWRLFFLQRDRYRSVTAADVQRVALAYLKRSNVTVGEFVPDSTTDCTPVTAAVEVAAMVKEYKGDPTAVSGETFDTSIANLDARTQHFTLRTDESRLLPKGARRGGQFRADAAFRRREIGVRQADRRTSRARC
jgi:zinc protease